MGATVRQGTVTGFSVEITSKSMGKLMEAMRDHGQLTRLTLNGVGAVLYTADGIGQTRTAALVEKRLREIDPTVTVRRVTSI